MEEPCTRAEVCAFLEMVSRGFSPFPVSSTRLLFILCVAYIHVNSTQARVTWEEGTPDEKMPPPDWPVGEPLECFLDWRDREREREKEKERERERGREGGRGPRSL